MCSGGVGRGRVDGRGEEQNMAFNFLLKMNGDLLSLAFFPQIGQGSLPLRSANAVFVYSFGSNLMHCSRN